MQIPLVIFQFFALLPMWKLADQLRQLPLRQVASLIVSSKSKNEPLGMVGAAKPSMHFYTKQIVVYEGRSTGALVNLADRLRFEERRGWKGRPIFGSKGSKTALLVIDKSTTERPHWKGLSYKPLGEFGIYKVWRLDRRSLEKRANQLINKGFQPTWRIPRPERF